LFINLFYTSTASVTKDPEGQGIEKVIVSGSFFFLAVTSSASKVNFNFPNDKPPAPVKAGPNVNNYRQLYCTVDLQSLILKST